MQNDETVSNNDLAASSEHTARKILFAEDDKDIAALVELHLKDIGAEVVLVDNGADALERALTETWDLLVLDLGLPKVDGIDVARELKRHVPSLPIIVVSARNSETERIQGLDAGADDYLVKPFSMLELVARVKATFRRSDAIKQPSDKNIRAGDIVLDSETHGAYVDGRRIELTVREFGLLSEFVSHPGRVFSRADLLLSVWGSSYEGYRHTVNTHINRLRNKLEPRSGKSRYIHTVWGVGYKLEP